MERASHPYVAFSGGKDSAVCLDLARRLAPAMPAVLSHDEWILPETDAYIRRVPDLTIIAGPHPHNGGFQTWQNGPPDDPAITWIGGTDHPLERYVAAQGFDGGVMGLRAEESSGRRANIRARGRLYDRPNGLVQAYPIGDWGALDVWTYLLSRGLDYNRAYDRLAALGLPLREWRTGPWWNDRAISAGSLQTIQAGWPAFYQRFREQTGWGN